MTCKYVVWRRKNKVKNNALTFALSKKKDGTRETPLFDNTSFTILIFTKMEFIFKNDIKESKGAVNTCENVAKKLATFEVKFTAVKGGAPAIFFKREGSEKFEFLAQKTTNKQDEEYYDTYNGWHTIFPKNNGDEFSPFYLFEYLTDAAEIMVQKWIFALIDDYCARLENQ